jgi:signal transduction histidine kinase
MTTPDASAEALQAITVFSRRVADAEDPGIVGPLLADAAERLLGGGVVVILTTTEHGPEVSATRGCDPAQLGPPDSLDSETARALVERLTGIGQVRSYLLTSGGGLYGGMVVGWSPANPPSAATERTAEALADIAATGLDRAFRTSELHRTIRELVDSREELARTASLRSLGQMSAVVAHEVKNPLTSIGGVLQVLRKRFGVGTQEYDVVGKVLARIAELDRMVDELLAFARPRDPSRRPVSCGTLVDEAVTLFQQDPIAARVVVDVHTANLSASVDPGMLQRVIHNLLINAAHAMDGVGRIVLACAPVDGGVELSVTDTGPGVPEELRPRIFEPFFTTKARGSGLGLAIARQVVTAHGGSLTLRPVERGACFVVRLPVVAP